MIWYRQLGKTRARNAMFLHKLIEEGVIKIKMGLIRTFVYLYLNKDGRELRKDLKETKK